ncbi:MAG: transglutaminase domain-containing protein [Spirochaetota bacterium]
MSPIYSHRRSALLATAVFLVLLAAFYVLLSVSGAKPVIEETEPAAVAPGEELIITGSHFGDSRGSSKVRLGGSAPTSSAYVEWSDSRIVIEVPEDATSGLAYVETERGRSNGVLFANARHVRSEEVGESSSARPVVEQIEPTNAEVGEVVTIHGRRFGADRKGGTVSFTLAPGAQEDHAVGSSGRAGRVPVSEQVEGYEYWSPGEIRVRVPDGAVSGSVIVRTARGESEGREITIDQPVGEKRFVDRQSHAVAASVTLDSVQISEDGEDGTVFLWIPQIVRSPEQRNHEKLTESKSPLFAPASGPSLYRIRDPRPEEPWSFRRSVLFDRYAVETAIDPDAVPTEYRQSENFMRRYTQEDALLPVDADSVISVARELGNSSRNPYSRARNTYEYVLSALDPVDQVGSIGPLEALRDSEANPYGYATLTVTLLRAQNIPARLIGGYVVCGGEQLQRHYWAEFYIEGFGWVPMDPAAADRAVCERFRPVENATEYYFGNVDSRRIAYSKGVARVPHMHPEGRTERVETMYALQSHHQEAVGDIRWYRVRWHDVEYLGKY